MKLINYKIDNKRTIEAKSFCNMIAELTIPVGVGTAKIIDRVVTNPVPKRNAPYSVSSDGVYYRDGKVLEPEKWEQTVKFFVERVSDCLVTSKDPYVTIHTFRIETTSRKDLCEI